MIYIEALIPILILSLVLTGLIGIYKFLERVKLKVYEIKDIMERDFEFNG